MAHKKSGIINILAVLGLLLMATPSPAIEDKPVLPAAGTTPEQLKNMTLEEKVEFWDKRQQAWMAARMTPEKKKELIENIRQMREKMKDMTPEEKGVYLRKQREERIAKMSPEEQQEHQMMMDMLRGMSPEEKRDFWKGIVDMRLARMTPEERKAFEERRRAMQERIKNMTPEERQKWHENMLRMRESMEEPEL
jgi:hypothetical protein